MTTLFEFTAVGPAVESQRQLICNWLTSIGVDPSLVRNGHVTQGDAGYELHLTEMRRDDNGRLVAIVENGRLVGMETADRIVQLGDNADWPGAEADGGDHPGDAAPGG